MVSCLWFIQNSLFKNLLYPWTIFVDCRNEIKANKTKKCDQIQRHFQECGTNVSALQFTSAKDRRNIHLWMIFTQMSYVLVSLRLRFRKSCEMFQTFLLRLKTEMKVFFHKACFSAFLFATCGCNSAWWNFWFFNS